MKKIPLIIAIAILYAVGMIAITSCGNSDKKSNEEPQEHTEGHEHGEGGGHEHGEGEEHEHGEGEEHEHGGHEHGEGHMKHMNDVRNWLKQQLGDKYNDPVPPATEAQMAMGKKTFMTICAACHGMSGKGDGAAAAALNPKPADFTDPEHSSFYSDQGRLYIIKNGIKGSAMVGWQASLNEKQIKAVYAYVRSLRSTDEAGGHEHGHSHGDGMYTCSMHPKVSGNEGDKCPKCGMELVLKEHGHDNDGDDHDDDGHEHEHEH